MNTSMNTPVTIEITNPTVRDTGRAPRRRARRQRPSFSACSGEHYPGHEPEDAADCPCPGEDEYDGPRPPPDAEGSGADADERPAKTTYTMAATTRSRSSGPGMPACVERRRRRRDETGIRRNSEHDEHDAHGFEPAALIVERQIGRRCVS